MLLLGLLVLFKTSWIGLCASQRGQRGHRAGEHGDRMGCAGLSLRPGERGCTVVGGTGREGPAGLE